MSYTHVTAPTQYVEAGGVRHAYRRFGKPGGIPLVFLVHFRGGMDNWDPAVTDGLAAKREVILFDYAGVAGSSGEVPETFEAFGDDSAEVRSGRWVFRRPTFSASPWRLRRADPAAPPRARRRWCWSAPAPRGGEAEGRDPKALKVAANPVPTMEDFLFLFFEPTENHQQAGRDFWARRHQRTVDVDLLGGDVDVAAIAAVGEPVGEGFSQLKTIQQPTLVVNGSHDIMVPTINSYILQQHR